ncbi:MAG: GNAT family N-acetyltransferase [Pseudomonadota bacterium]
MATIPDGLTIGGYYPGSIGRIVLAHALYYYEDWGFDASFEAQVARELGEFIGVFDPIRDGFWTARFNGTFAGSIAINGNSGNPDGARLRWFIVASGFRGMGLGNVLISNAVKFCRETGHKSIFLWTFRGLEAARILYEKNGFTLAQETPVEQWGGSILEQKYELIL